MRVTLRENGTNITGTLVELREDAIVMKNNAADRAFLFPSGSRLRDAVPFYDAERYHQEYFARNPGQPYCAVVVAPKVAKFRKHFTERLKRKA